MKVHESYQLKGRKQKISTDNYQQISRTESKELVGVQTFMRITEKNFTNVELTQYNFLEQILSSPNLNLAYKQVRSNKGGSGVDNMDLESLGDYLLSYQDSLIDIILEGKYRPNPVRRVFIPKGERKTRSFGIPTVVDRLIQQAIQQVLSPIYEQQFSDSSYGFRPRRGAHQALNRIKTDITVGYL